MSLFVRLDAASARAGRWRILSSPEPLPSMDGQTSLWGMTVEIDDAGALPGFLQVGRSMPPHFGVRIPGAPGREHLADLLRLPSPRRPPTPA